jgi:hypothetical protein
MLAVVAAALGSALQPLEPIDYWWGVRLGDLIRAAQAIPTDDPLIYTPLRGQIVDGQWLAKVLLSLLHQTGGVGLALALRSGVAIAAAVMLMRACLVAGAGTRSAAVVAGLAAILFVPGLAVRPQLFAVVPFIFVWHAALHPPRRIVALVLVGVVVAFWANVHGSFILIGPLLGAGLIDAAAAHRRTHDGAQLRRWTVLAAVCVMAPLLNPYGPGLAAYVADTILVNGGGTSAGVLGVEWGPPTVQTLYGAGYFMSVLAVIGLLAAGHRPRAGEALLLLAFGLLALSSIRHILWWSLIVTPYLARGAGGLLTSQLGRAGCAPGSLPAGSTRLNVICLVSLGMLVVLSMPWTRGRLPLPPARTALVDASTPVAVGEYLAAHPTSGRIFNDTNMSAYLAWRLGAPGASFVDNRFELHPAEVWEAYTTISRGYPSWQRRLDGYGVTRLVLDPTTQPGLVEAVQDAPGWQLVYDDGLARVFDRSFDGQP